MLSNYIFILLHSYNGNPRDLLPIENLLKANYHEPDVHRLVVVQSALAAPRIDELVNRLLQDVDEAWKKKKSQLPDDISPKLIFIGHSMGALVARKLYVCACGENAGVPLESGIDARYIRPWAAHVERIVLLAGMNNGWSINFHLNFWRMITMGLGSLLQPVLSVFGEPVIYSIRKGGTFITQLKLQSIRMQQVARQKGVGDAPVIQLLGTVDDLVSPEDNIDLISGNQFIYMDMPYSGHKDVILVTDQKKVVCNGHETTAGNVRAARLLQALTQTPQQLKDDEVTTAESARMNRDETVTDVVFVIHGIRDEGFWTQKVAQRVVKLARDLQIKKTDASGKEVVRKFETETSTYGYFPLLHFALPNYRRAKVEWLMEQYSENMARYPNAEFSYVEHSNGTYLLSSALEKYQACKFKHVLFAGSVVNHHYDWQKLIDQKRVQKVYNIAASADYVVGIFPHAFHYLGSSGLGAAGYAGFRTNTAVDVSGPQGFTQIVTVPGGHGAAIKEDYWENIAHFIVEGKLKIPIQKDAKKRRFEINGAVAVLLFLLCLLAVAFAAIEIWRRTPSGEWRVIFLFAYLFVVWKIITRF